jgi:hypothetical protein
MKLDKPGTPLNARVQAEMLKQVPGCWGHYQKMNCMNAGFLAYELRADGINHFKRCPFENSCKKKSLTYAKNSDPEQAGKIDKPRQWIRELEKVG